MPPEPVPADPGWDEDLAWLDRDPERETWLDRAREHDGSPLEVDYADYTPLTEEELAEIREAAADELLAVEAATTAAGCCHWWQSPGPEIGGAGSHVLGMRILRPAASRTVRRQAGHPAAPAGEQEEARPGSPGSRRDELPFPLPAGVRTQ